MSLQDINRSVLIPLVLIYNIAASETVLNFKTFPLNAGLEFAETGAVPAAEKIMERMESKVLRRKFALIQSEFPRSDKSALRELLSGQGRKALRCSPVVHTYEMNVDQIRDLSFHIFCDRSLFCNCTEQWPSLADSTRQLSENKKSAV